MSVGDDREYYVVFMDSDKPCLRWLKQGYRHCIIVRDDYGIVWTVVQDGYHFLDVSVYSRSENPTVSDLIKNIYNEACTEVIKTTRVIKPRYRGHVCLFNCVEVCKAFLGIKKPFIFTPYQLSRWLK